MLHTINLPSCIQHLEWIVRFQRVLLYALCNSSVAAANVTIIWVKTQCPDVDHDWIEQFCGWAIKGKSMLNRMQTVASLSIADKRALVNHYKRNIRYSEAFGSTNPSPPAVAPLPNGLSTLAATAYSDFFEMFYAPIFYDQKGYSINAIDLNGERFTRNKYLTAYHAANDNLKVCPLCDGGMDGAELDHWMAKKYLPELNCYPQNLVEICGACNKRTNKGEKLVFDKETADPFSKWFHPYLRPAVGLFTVDRQERKVRLVSDNASIQERLDKLDNLINLSKRWSQEWKTQLKRIEKKIYGARRRGQSLDKDALQSKIQAWKNETEDEVGIEPYALLAVYILSLALDPSSDEYAEVHSYAQV
ncbi:MAG: hypothetical protein ABFC84_11920 [Veillonellales bacterium]